MAEEGGHHVGRLRLLALRARLLGEPLLGVAGVRDPDSPCAYFAPGEPFGTCHGDGHYVCDECREWVPPCPRCGARPINCICRDDDPVIWDDPAKHAALLADLRQRNAGRATDGATLLARFLADDAEVKHGAR